MNSASENTARSSSAMQAPWRHPYDSNLIQYQPNIQDSATETTGNATRNHTALYTATSINDSINTGAQSPSAKNKHTPRRQPHVSYQLQYQPCSCFGNLSTTQQCRVTTATTHVTNRREYRRPSHILAKTRQCNIGNWSYYNAEQWQRPEPPKRRNYRYGTRFVF